jgi:hypothetical protein
MATIYHMDIEGNLLHAGTTIASIGSGNLTYIGNNMVLLQEKANGGEVHLLNVEPGNESLIKTYTTQGGTSGAGIVVPINYADQLHHDLEPSFDSVFIVEKTT